MAKLRRFGSTIGYVIDDGTGSLDKVLLTFFIPDNDTGQNHGQFASIDDAIKAGGVFAQYKRSIVNGSDLDVDAILRRTRNFLAGKSVAFAQMSGPERDFFRILRDQSWNQQSSDKIALQELCDIGLKPLKAGKICQSGVDSTHLQFGKFQLSHEGADASPRLDEVIEPTVDLKSGLLTFEFDAGSTFFENLNPGQPFLFGAGISGFGSNRHIRSERQEVSVFDVKAMGTETFRLAAKIDLSPQLEDLLNDPTQLYEFFERRRTFTFLPKSAGAQDLLKFHAFDTLGNQLSSIAGAGGGQRLAMFPSPSILQHNIGDPLNQFEEVWQAVLIPTGDYPIMPASAKDGLADRVRRIKVGPSNAEVLEVHESGRNPAFTLNFASQLTGKDALGGTGTGNFLRRSLLKWGEEAGTPASVLQAIKDADPLGDETIGTWPGFGIPNVLNGNVVGVRTLTTGTISSDIGVFSSQPDGLVRYSKKSPNAKGDALGYNFEVIADPGLGRMPFTFLSGIPDKPLGGNSKPSDLEAELAKHRFRVRSKRNEKLLRRSTLDASAVVFDVKNKDVTPQGFELAVANGLRRYTFAKTATVEGENGQKILELEVTIRNQLLAGLFQQNDFVMVLPTRQILDQSRQSVTGIDIKTKVQLGDWGFELDIVDNSKPPIPDPSDPKAVNNSTVMILKYRKGSIDELIEQSHLWDNEKLLSKEWIKHAREAMQKWREKVTENEGERGYDIIRKILESPDWTGVLLINPVIDLNALPSSLQGLVAGIDMKLFRGHHLGFSQNKVVTYGDEGPRIEKSSLFGLIDYQDDSDFERKDDNGTKNVFDFKVQKLQVLLNNSEVKDFICRIKVKTPHFFDDKIKKVNGGAELPHQAGGNEQNDVVFGILGRYVSFIDDHGNKVGRYSFIHDKPIELVHESNKFFKQLTIDRIEVRTTSVEPVDQEKAVAQRLLSGGDPGETPDETKKIKTELVLDTTIAFKDDIGAEFLKDVFSFDALGVNGVSIPFSVDVERYGKRWKTGSWGPEARLAFEGISLSTDPSKRRGDSLLSRFPIKFKGFQFFDSGREPKELDYMTLVPRTSSLPVKFKYGLEWDVDFGSLAKLLGFDADLKGTLLTGWSPDKVGWSKFAVGLRFDGKGGDRLDLALGSALRIQAGYFDMFNVGSGADTQSYLVASDLRIKIFSQWLPSNDKDKFGIVLAPNPKDPLGGPLGWMLATKVDQLAFIENFCLILGQRFKFKNSSLQTPQEIIKALTDLTLTSLEKGLPDKKKLELAKKYHDDFKKALEYNTENEWLIGLAGSAASKVLEGYAVYNPPSLFGGQVGVKDLFNISILYQQESPELGIYTGTLTLSENIRTMDFGGIRIQLPRIIVKVDTDGGYAIIIGLNPDKPDDFSNAAGAEVGIFKGDGGFMYANIAGAAIKDIPRFGNRAEFPDAVGTPMFSPVTQITVAARGGLGRTFKKLIFEAHASITIYAILSGTWGQLNEKAFKDDLKKAIDAYKAQSLPTKYHKYWGEVGVIAEVVGVVDFGVTRQRLAARLQVGLGIVFETLRDTFAYVRGELQISLEWVIARFRIFRKTIEIKINLHFSTEYRDDFILSKGNEVVTNKWFEKNQTQLLESNTPGYRTLPLIILEPDWTQKPAAWPGPKKIYLPVLVTTDLVLNDDGVPHLVPLAFIPYSNATLKNGGPDSGALQDVLELVLEWSLMAFPNLPKLGQPIPLAMLRDIASAIVNHNWRDNRGSWSAQTGWNVLKGRFNIRLVDTVDRGVSGGTYFNLRNGLNATIAYDDGTVGSHTFGNVMVSGDYLDDLDTFFDELRVKVDARRGEKEITVKKAAKQKRSLDDFLFEEYLESILRSVWARIEKSVSDGKWADDAKGPVPLTKPLATRENLCAFVLSETMTISNILNRQAFSGARVFKGDDPKVRDSVSLYERAGLAMNVSSWPDAAVQVTSFKLDHPDLAGPVSSVTFDQLDVIKINEVIGTKPIFGDVVIEQTLPFEKIDGERHALSEQVPVSNGQSTVGAMIGVPAALMAKSYALGREREAKGLHRENLNVVLEGFVQKERSLKNDVREPISFDSYVFIGLPITSRPNNGGTFELEVMNEADRRLLDDMLMAKVDSDRLEFDFFAQKKDENGLIATYKKVPVDKGKSFLGRVNLSEDPNPTRIDQARILAALGDPLVFARPVKNQASSFIELLFRAANTNSGGYVLHLDDWSEPPETKIWLGIKVADDGAAAPNTSSLESYVNKIYVREENLVRDLNEVSGMVLHHVEKLYLATGEPGIFSATIRRPNPNTLYRDPLGPASGPRNFTREMALSALENRDRQQLGVYRNLDDAGLFVEERLDDAGGREVDLAKRYNLLQVAVTSADGFNARLDKLDLPTGPVDSETGDYVYTWSVPANKFVDNARNDLFEHEPAARDQEFMYKAIGRSMTIQATFRDVLGYSCGQDTVVSKTIHGKYFDPLISLTELSGLKVMHDVNPTTGDLEIIMTFQPQGIGAEEKKSNGKAAFYLVTPNDGGVDQEERVRSIRADYDRMMQQLRDANNEYGIQCILGLKGTSDNTLFLSTADRLKLYRELKKCVAELDKMLEGQDAQIKKLAVVKFGLKGVVPAEGVEKYVVRLCAKRKIEDLVWQEIRESKNAKALSFEADIPIFATEDMTDGTALRRLATNIQGKFADLRVAQTRDGRHKDVLYILDKKLVAIKLDKTRVRPAFGAITPISNKPYIKDKAAIWPWDIQKAAPKTPPLQVPKEPWTVRGISDFDQDLALENYLSDVDQVLSVGATADVWSSGERGRELIGDLLARKDKIADKMSTRVISILNDAEDRKLIGKTQKLIRENVANSMKKRLSKAIDIDTLLVFPVVYAQINAPAGFVLYGSVNNLDEQTSGVSGIQAGVGNATPEEEPKLKPQFMPAAIRREGTSASLVLQFDGREPKARKEVYPFRLEYWIEYVRWDFDGDKTPFGVRWLRLFDPEKIKLSPFSGQQQDSIDVPVLFKRLVKKPDLSVREPLQVSIEPGDSLTVAMKKAREWGYVFDVERSVAAVQDDVQIDMEFNLVESESSQRLSESDRDLGDVLYEYTIMKQLINKPELRFLWLEALAYWGRYIADELGRTRQVAGVPFGGPQKVTHYLEVFESGVDGEPDKLDVQLRNRGTQSLGKVEYYIAEITAQTGNGQPEKELSQKSGNEVLREIRINFPSGSSGGGYYAGRRITAKKLDVLQYENVWPSVSVIRNKTLGEYKDIDETFTYRTEAVRTGEPFTPLLEVLDPINLPYDTLKAALEALFEALLKTTPSTGDLPFVDLTWGYDSGILDSLKIKDESLKVFKSDPIGSLTARQSGDVKFSEAVEAIGLSIDDWFLKNGGRPAWGRLVFEVRVYSRLAQIEKPLLVLKDVRYALTASEVVTSQRKGQKKKSKEKKSKV